MKHTFSRIIMFITIGFYLTFIKVNVFNLNYFLPLIGYILLIINFSKLKNINQYFKLEYFISIYFFIFSIINLTLLSTPYYNILNNTFFYITQFVIQVMFYHFYIKGIYACDLKSRLSKSSYHQHMIIYYTVIFLMLLSIISQFFLVSITVLIMYIALFQNLYKTSLLFNDNDYPFYTSKLTILPLTLCTAIYIVVMIISTSYHYYGPEKIDFKQLHTQKNEQTDYLVNKGLPKELVNSFSSIELDALNKVNSFTHLSSSNSFINCDTYYGCIGEDDFQIVQYYTLNTASPFYRLDITNNFVLSTSNFVKANSHLRYLVNKNESTYYNDITFSNFSPVSLTLKNGNQERFYIYSNVSNVGYSNMADLQNNLVGYKHWVNFPFTENLMITENDFFPGIIDYNRQNYTFTFFLEK